MSLPHHLSLGAEGAQAPPTPDGPISEEAIAVEAVAGAIERAGMAAPAALLLSAVKPLSWMGGQLLWIAQPFAEALGLGRRGDLGITGLARLLEEEESVDRLLEKLDAPVRRGEG